MHHNALKILREQSRVLAKKSGNRVKATFSKIKYTEPLSGLASALSAMATISTVNQVKKEEVLEEDLTGKINISDELKEQNYKFEIYNEKYRFRLFTYIFAPIYPNKMLLDENIAKVSIVGAGMIDRPGVASTMFETLAQQGINIRMISTSEIKISCLVDKEQAQKAVKALHKVFELESTEIAEVKGDLPNI